MNHFVGRITEIWEETGELAGRIACPLQAVPAAGQYLLASDPADCAAPLATRLFASATRADGFDCAPGLPRAWLPGTELALSGLLGHGFSLPESARHTVFAALSGHPARLRPLVTAALARGCAATLFADRLREHDLSRWPAALEVYPLAALPDCLTFADYLALEADPPALAGLRTLLGLGPTARLPFTAQVLLDTPAPCGGLADCGVCAVRARRGWKLACKDGPVFEVNELEW
jgi:dihydroorotate dehydrogenase electron transfer subunit